MLKRVTDGVLIHQSELLRNNSIVVQGREGMLLIDPGITNDEMNCLANDLIELGQPVVAGFATHPDWDHVLWHPRFGDVARYGTAICAKVIGNVLADPNWRADVAEGLPPEIAGEVPMDLFGLITGLPSGATHLPWGGPRIRIIEHQAHSPGHAALLIAELRVLVAGDMLSDVLIPFLDFSAADPIADNLAALQLLESVADDIDFFIPGHGSPSDADELRTRIAQDRAYVLALRDGGPLHDPRLGSSAKPGWEWLDDVHDGQSQQLAQRRIAG